MNGERTIAAKTRSRKRSAPEVASAAEMHTAAEMPAAMTAEMPSAMAATTKMPSASVATSAVAPAAMTTATATFRGSIVRSRQHGRKNNDGNAKTEF
ncbi:MAG TPA: hypothetical protein VGO49_15720 [Bradyrhizobium sp.]|jgi:hypothetical protein|nr:hypothetical protein [Bradyrhizobium sp.]